MLSNTVKNSGLRILGMIFSKNSGFNSDSHFRNLIRQAYLIFNASDEAGEI